MKVKFAAVILCFISFTVTGLQGQPGKTRRDRTDQKIQFIRNDADRRVDVMADGKLFTSYRWHDPIFLNIMKPVLCPIIASSGTEVTRGFPLNPKPVERADHLHQIGACFDYGNVNGYDFWNNSSAISESKRGKYGTIRHLSIDKMADGTSGGAMMITSESWTDPAGKEILAERSEYHFFAKGTVRIIDRIITLTATGGDVLMADTKEGGFGIRVARQLEMPSEGELILTDERGIPTKVDKMSNEGITGNFRSSEGVTGEAVYATRGKWVDLSGRIGNETVCVVMIDHPKNPGYPTYWHARGYGLLLANPLGAGAYTGGKSIMNFRILSGQSATFRFRLVINSGKDLSDAEINAYTEGFASLY